MTEEEKKGRSNKPPQEWMTDYSDAIPDSTIPPGTDNFTATKIRFYLDRFLKMDRSAILKEVAINLPKRSDREFFEESVKGLSVPELAKRSARALANASPPQEKKKITNELTARLANEMKAVSSPPSSKKPIVMPPVLESDKKKSVPNILLNRENPPEWDHERQTFKLPVKGSIREIIEENRKRSYQHALDSVIIEEDEIPTRPDSPIPLAVLKERAEIPIEQKTIIPPPSSNMSGVRPIPFNEIPREEIQFRINTKRDVRGGRLEPENLESSSFKPPAKGSDHSAIRLREHSPDSGRYSIVPPHEEKVKK